MNIRTKLWQGAAALTLAAGLASAGSPESLGPGVVKGRVVDALGKPIAGAKVWIKPALTTGLVQTRTDANGQYSAEGLITTIPYNVFVWSKFTYNDKDVCMRVAPVSTDQYDSFVPKTGVVRDFRLKFTGPVEDRDDVFYGADLRILQNTLNKVEVTFTPIAPLPDGTTGKPFTRSGERSAMLTNIPLGVYRVTAQMIEANGSRHPVRVSRTSSDESTMGPSAVVDWQSKDSCVGSFGSGLDRSYLYIGR